MALLAQQAIIAAVYFRSLQVLRGWAAVAVVLYHIHHYIASPTMGNDADTLFRFFGEEFSYGAWFFFVLSGFLMAYLIDTNYQWFIARRLLRIYPTYLLAAGAVLLGKALTPGFTVGSNLPRCLTLLPFGTTAGGKLLGYPLAVEWTLVYEVFFYLVCAAFALRPTRRLFLPFLVLWAGVIVLGAIGQIPGAALSPAESWLLPSWRHIGLSTMNLLFIAGAITYYVYGRLGTSSRARWWACAAGGVLAFVGSRQVVSALAVTGLLGLAFSLVVLAVCLWERTANPVTRKDGFFRQLGDHSYGLYLVHVPVMSAIFIMAQHRFGGPLGTGWGIAALVATLLTGWHFGKIDVALHRYSRRQLDKRRNGTHGGAPRETMRYSLAE